MRGGFSLSELMELNAIINEAKVFNAKASISVGDRVFVVQKTKKTLGTVEKVNIKKAIVEIDGKGRYNVPLAMLEVA